MENFIVKKEKKDESSDFQVIYRGIESEKDTENKNGILNAIHMQSTGETEDWMQEMDQMLDGFSRQATLTLRNIRKCFTKSGRSFNEEFKKHFLRESSERVATTYTRFEMELLWNKNENPINEASDSKHGILDASMSVAQVKNLPENRFGAQKLPLAKSTVDQKNIRSILVQMPKDGILKTRKRVSFSLPEENTVTQLPDDVVEIIDSSDEENAPKLQKIVDHDLIVKRVWIKIPTNSKNVQQSNSITIKQTSGEAHQRVELKNNITLIPIKKLTSNGNQSKCRFCNYSCNEHEKNCPRRRYECTVCNKFSCFGKTDLSRHMRRHNGEKPYQCEVCMKCYTRKENLDAHMMAHCTPQESGPRPSHHNGAPIKQKKIASTLEYEEDLY